MAIISMLGAIDSINLCISVLNIRVLTGIYQRFQQGHACFPASPAHRTTSATPSMAMKGYGALFSTVIQATSTHDGDSREPCGAPCSRVAHLRGAAKGR